MQWTHPTDPTDKEVRGELVGKKVFNGGKGAKERVVGANTIKIHLMYEIVKE